MISPRAAFFFGILLTSPALNVRAQEKQLPKYSDADAAEHAGEQATVTGKLIAVSKSQKGTTYLNFGDRFPRQIFSGVVLARDEEKVSDVKQFEGKTIAITGRIELSPDKKPQIVISAREQIALAVEAGSIVAQPAPIRPAPAVAPPQTPPALPPSLSATKSAAPPAPEKPAAPARKIVLNAGWNSAVETGALTRKDLATIFSGRGQANENADGDSSIAVYPGISFLMLLAEAKKSLKLDGVSFVKSKIACPGLPLGSLWSHAFAGIFPGGFTRLCLITDSAEQVLSVQLVEETSRQRSTDITDLAGFHTYNFISYRVKGSEDLVIKHEVTGEMPGVVVVESSLIDPGNKENGPRGKSSSKTSGAAQSRGPRTGKVLERSRWFVPAPLVNLILRCVGNR